MAVSEGNIRSSNMTKPQEDVADESVRKIFHVLC